MTHAAPPFIRVLPHVLARMVQEADRFRTLEEHVARLRERGWPSEGSDLFLADYRSGRAVRFLICDDSDAGTAARNRMAAARVAEREGVPVHYAGADERAAFVAAVVSAGVPEAVVRFALFDREVLGDPYDINRNATLLATAGDAFLSTDDDTLCQFALPREPKPGLRLFSFAGPAPPCVDNGPPTTPRPHRFLPLCR